MKSSVSMFLIFLGSPDKIGTIGCYPDAVGMQVRVEDEEFCEYVFDIPR